MCPSALESPFQTVGSHAKFKLICLKSFSANTPTALLEHWEKPTEWLVLFLKKKRINPEGGSPSPEWIQLELYKGIHRTASQPSSFWIPWREKRDQKLHWSKRRMRFRAINSGISHKHYEQFYTLFFFQALISLHWVDWGQNFKFHIQYRFKPKQKWRIHHWLDMYRTYISGHNKWCSVFFTLCLLRKAFSKLHKKCICKNFSALKFVINRGSAASTTIII